MSERAEIAVAVAVERFLNSEVGELLLGMAQQEVQQAQEALLSVDPENTKAIRDLQQHAKVGRWFEHWLKELVTRGMLAARDITEWSEDGRTEDRQAH